MATGNNVPLFSARTEGDPPPLTPAHAARALLATHCWDTAAIKSGAVGDPAMKAGKTTGNPTGPLGDLGLVVPLGVTLFETILLNTPILRQGLRPEDCPQWSAAPATPAWSRRPARGLLDLLTWQSRRYPTDPGHRSARRHRGPSGGAGCRGPAGSAARGGAAHRMAAGRQAQTRRCAAAPDPPPAGKAPWRGMASLLATRTHSGDTVTTTALLQQLADLQALGHLPLDLPLQVLTVGVLYGNQAAVVEDVMVDTMPLPIAALSPESPVRQLLLDVADQADRLREAANKLGDDLRLAAGGDKLPWDRSLRLGETLVNEFTPVVRRMLGGLQRQPERADEAEQAWKALAHRLAWATAEPALAAAPPTAFLGRAPSDRIAHRLSLAEARYRATITQVLGPLARDHSERADVPLAEAGGPR